MFPKMNVVSYPNAHDHLEHNVLNNLDILDAATNQTLATNLLVGFIHGRLCDMFVIISYSVKNIRVKVLTDSTKILSPLSILLKLRSCYQTNFSCRSSAGGLLQFGTNILTIQIESQPGFEVQIVRSAIESLSIVPTIDPFQFDSGKREHQYTTVSFATTTVALTANFSNFSNLTLIKSVNYLAREKGVARIRLSLVQSFLAKTLL